MSPMWLGSLLLFHLMMVGSYWLSLRTGWVPSRVALTLFGEFDFFWYGLFIVAGIVMGTAVVAIFAEAQGDHTYFVWRGLAWVLVCGIIGARLFHISFPPPTDSLIGIESTADYWRNITLLLSIRQGGLHIIGGLLGGLLGWLIFAGRYRLPRPVWLDRLSIGLPVGLSVGQWGHFFNQDLYGQPTAVSWAWPIESIYRLPHLVEATHFHPIFLYLSWWHGGTAILLYIYWRQASFKPRRGDSFTLFILLFVLGQIIIGELQLNVATISLASEVDWPVTAVWVLPIGLITLIWRAYTSRQAL